MKKDGKIFISGGGNKEQTQKFDELFFNELTSNSKILYIPVALDRDHKGFESCFDWFASVINFHQGNKELDFEMILNEDDVPSLKNFDAVYIGGGDTYKLLNYIYAKELNTKLNEYLENGGLIYGGSAGAIILGKDIRTVEEENNKNYPFYEGLNLLSGYSIKCHFLDSDLYTLTQRANNYGLKILALPEESGVIFSSRNISFVGEHIEL